METIEVDRSVQHRSIVEYLSELCGIKTDRTARIAAMTVLSDLLKSAHVSLATKQICLQSGILEYLDDILDLATSVYYIDNMDILHIKLALQIIWELSLAPVCVQEQLVGKQFLKKIMSFVKLFNTPLQRYSHESTHFLKSVCEGQHVIGQISERFIEVDLGKLHTNDLESQSFATCPAQASECNLFDTRGDVDVNIAELFIENGYGMAKESVGIFSEDSWNDVFVTHVLFGPYFWAQIGKEIILKAKKIQMLLALEELQHCSAVVGNYVVVKYENTMFRCKILNDHGDYVVVMVIDYGMVVMVKEEMIFELPLSTELLQYQPQAKFCCLSGVIPPLLDTGIQQLSLGILVNLCRQKVVVGMSLYKLEIVDLLKKVLFCPIPSLILQSLSLINNLLSNPRMGSKLPIEDVMKWILEVCCNISYLNVSTELKEKLAGACFSCLSTLLFKNKNKRNAFYLNQGLETAVIFAGEYPKPSIVYNRVVRLLKNYIITFDKSSPEGRTSCEDSRHSTLRGGNGNSSILKSYCFEDASSSNEEEYYSQIESPCHKTTDDDVYIVNAGRKQTDFKEGQHYIKGSNTGLRNSITVELRESKSLQTISAETLAEVTCAMFNSGKGGTIYFGIDIEGIVFGISLNRDERDEFRMGIDKMMTTSMKPSVLHYQFTVSYVPVVESSINEGVTNLEDIFVAEIYLENKPDVFYSCNKQCFYRFGDKTNSIHTQDIRQLIVLEEEANFKKEILQLQSKLLTLKIADKNVSLCQNKTF